MKNQEGTSPEPLASPEATLAAAIEKWKDAPVAHEVYPAQRWLLRFRDARIERGYLEAERRRTRRLIVMGMLLICVAATTLGFFDPILTPDILRRPLGMVRNFVLIPVTVLGVLGAIFIDRPTPWFVWSTLLIGIYGVAHCVLLWFSGTVGFDYLKYGIFEVEVGVFMLFGLPLRWSMTIVILYAGAFAMVAYHVGTDASELANFHTDVIILFFFGGFATYKYEAASRRQFIASAMARSEYSERIAAEAEHRRWLEVIAAFLRHELRNAMVGISTSIELADRQRGAAGKYLERGRQALEFMRRLLTQAADATSLESALSQQTFETIDLSALLEERLEEQRGATPLRKIEAAINVGVKVKGNADRLIQMFDKLLNNALEHGDPSEPIFVGLITTGTHCVLTVRNLGDPLPDDREQIFAAFVSKKDARFGGANLGLGLFVARTIVTRHGGSIFAQPPTNGAGAELLVELPLLSNT